MTGQALRVHLLPVAPGGDGAWSDLRPLLELLDA